MSLSNVDREEAQQALWRISAALASARLEDRDKAIELALSQAGAVLNVAGVGIWRTNLRDQVTVQRYAWSKRGFAGIIEDNEFRPADPHVAAEMFANEGIAVFPVSKIAGDRPVPTEWHVGSVLLALVDYTGDVAECVGATNERSDFEPWELVFLQNFATIFRQFFARIRIEQELQHRLDLEAFVVRSVADLGSVSGESLDSVVLGVLQELCDRFNLQGAALLRVGANELQLQCHVGEAALIFGEAIERPPGHPLVLSNTEATSLLLFDVAKVLLGSEQEVVGPDDTAEVTYIAATVGEERRENLVLLHAKRKWDAGELEALRLIAPAIVQNRSRVESEALLEFREAVQAEVAGIAADFLRLERGSASDVIRDGLQRVCTRLGATFGILFSIDGEREGTHNVELLWTDGPPPYQEGQSIPALPARIISRLRERKQFSAVLPTKYLHAEVQPFFGTKETWTAIAMPISGSGSSVVAVGIAGDHSDRMETLVELLSTFVDLASQLRVRLELEKELEREAETQALLRRAATTLTHVEDFDRAVDEVLASVATFFNLAGLASWRPSPNSQHYVVRNSVGWGPPAGSTVDVGADPVVDAAVCQRGTPSRVEEATTSDVASTFAVLRGTGRLESVLVASSGGGLDDALCARTLDELSRLLERMQEYVASERYSRNAFGAAPVGIVLCDRDWKIITGNAAFAWLAGRDDPTALLGVHLPELFQFEGDVFPIGAEEIAMVVQGGTQVWVRTQVTAVEDGLTDDPLWLVHVEDITAQRRSDQLLRFQATHDELTGLANRRMLLDAVHEQLEAGQSPAVLILDLDRFKNVNDTLGHDLGDELLIAVADRLRMTVRPADMVARLGGDEFAVLLRGRRTDGDAVFVAQRLLALLREPVGLGRQVVYPSTSIGISIGDPSVAVEEVVRHADTAMYRAKAEGRNRYATFDQAMQDQVAERLEVESGLRNALRHDEFEVHYQPEVSMLDGSVFGAEALIRWHHPERGILPAGAFITVAEETGIVVELGEYVLNEACREAAGWGNTDATIRVNFAAAQLQRPETVEIVRRTLNETGLAPGRLCVEITESDMMNDVEAAERVLQRLKEIGVKVAVDDFGTGFSSLAYLKRFPVDALKVDRAFVKDLEDANNDGAFVRAIISLAEALGLDIVAEGVENQAQVDQLIQLGCIRAQGYFFGRPAPAAEMRDRMMAR